MSGLAITTVADSLDSRVPMRQKRIRSRTQQFLAPVATRVPSTISPAMSGDLGLGDLGPFWPIMIAKFPEPSLDGGIRNDLGRLGTVTRDGPGDLFVPN